MTIVDAHHHLWDPAERPYPWMDGDALGSLRRRYDESDLRAVAGSAGVTATVVVQAVGTVAETEALLATAADSDLIAGVVGWVDLTAPDVSEVLERLRTSPGGRRLVGVRHQVEDEADAEWLRRNDVLRGLSAVADAGLVYDLLVRVDQLQATAHVVTRLPELRVVLDHAAKPKIARGEWQPWFDRLCLLAEQPHVRCKLSGLVTEARWDGWVPSDIGDYVEAVLDLFGAHRVLFGSDWPVCTLAADYATVVDLAVQALASGSERERDAVLARNAVELYQLNI